jgi:hypothetical protein
MMDCRLVSHKVKGGKERTRRGEERLMKKESEEERNETTQKGSK